MTLEELKNSCSISLELSSKWLYYSNLGIEYPYEVYENKEELLNKIKEYGKKYS